MENDILIDFRFTKAKPGFGDLFLITGEAHPKFSPRNTAFEKLAPLGFEQLDDFFGILNTEEGGDDVIVWLFPMQNGEEVFHNSGPFDAIRLSYSALRNTPESIATLEECFNTINASLDTEILFDGNTVKSFDAIKKKADEIVAHWRENNVEPGSDASLLIDEDDEDWEDEDWEDQDWVDEDEEEKK
ncbi:hypothetical protein [Chitinophaga sp. Cy-1792]|uniref:hypothetical protein n=1 Tax=Chitinophaga sp. Cy-1792 TaxID=2608339 RepID=UPI0014212EA6|nr:hypothetical protein [Chitinophaga sp. Cy-1792]NIG53509.1 hypothetical protein [Chitinophaga sp. Cy-1792]